LKLTVSFEAFCAKAQQSNQSMGFGSLLVLRFSFAFGRARPHPGQATPHSSVESTLHPLADRTQGEKAKRKKKKEKRLVAENAICYTGKIITENNHHAPNDLCCRDGAGMRGWSGKRGARVEGQNRGERY
jgi:hypothetical protein